MSSADRRAMLVSIASLSQRLEMRSIAQALQPLLRSELTIQQLKVLTSLVASADGRTMSELAADLRVTQATMSRLVDRLVHGGLAERRVGADDRRVKRVRASALGHAAVQQLLAARAEFADNTLAKLTNEELALVERALHVVLHVDDHA